MKLLNRNTDAELLLRLKGNDEVAFELVFYRYKGRLYDFIRKSLPQEEDSEGVVQEIFVKLWTNRTTLDPEKSISGYLFTIARNEVYGKLRKLYTRRKYQEELFHLVETSGDTTEKQLEYMELERIIDDLIEKMPEKRKEVFQRSRLKGQTYIEISSAMNISENTVDTHIRKALNFMRTELRKAFHSMLIMFF